MLRPSTTRGKEVIDYLFAKLENGDRLSPDDMLLLKNDSNLTVFRPKYAQELECFKLLLKKKSGVCAPLSFQFFLNYPSEKFNELASEIKELRNFKEILADCGVSATDISSGMRQYLYSFSTEEQAWNIIRCAKTCHVLHDQSYVVPYFSGALPN